jgi:replicative DNA helicase
MITPLESALFYATEKMWPVFPLKPRDKRPLFPAAHEVGHACRGECGKLGHGLNDAVTDPAIIREWWGANPTAGIGIATGKRAGFFALDKDIAHGGNEALAALLEANGALPDTVTQQTGGGGQHFLFEYPPIEIRNSAGKIGVGLDTRGEGGYICGAPTIHPSGNPYRWIVAPSQHVIAPAPDWLIHALISKKVESVASPAGVSGENVYPKGTRHAAMVSLAGTMRRRGMEEPAIMAAILAEAARFIPPATESDIQALKLTVKRVCGYEPTAPLATQPRDRIASEWAFCKILFEYPSEHVDFLDITPENFGEPQLREYYKLFLAGMSTAQAALQAGVLAELEAYQNYFVPRIDDYANAIRNFSRYEAVAWLGSRLAKAAQSADENKITGLVLEIIKTAEPATTERPSTIKDIADDVEAEIIARSQDPREVWGIPYPLPRLSTLTGGKHPGELIMLAGEPGVGKSWLMAQDALFTAEKGIPVFYWSGEMGKKQTMRRLYALMGVNKRNMETGHMTERDWDLLSDAKQRIPHLPLHIESGPMHIHQCRSILKREVETHEIQEFIFDYATLINAPGKDDIEKSAVISREMKIICQDDKFPLAGLLLSSVTKAAFDNTVASKAAMKGSGQQSHDADIVYFLTEFSQIENDKVALRFLPSQWDHLSTLHIKKGRELDKELIANKLHLSRMNGPNFQEELQEARKLP